jgi:hypothetical protein
MQYFTDEIFLQTKKDRFKARLIYTIVALVYALCSWLIFYWYRTLVYKSPTIKTVKAIQYSITAVFAVFSFIYLSIKMRRANSLYKFCYNLKTAKREVSTAVYLETDETFFIKDGVDCKSLVFLEWNKYKKDYYERRVFVFYEKEFPDIPEKANVEFITQGNFLISYELKAEEL